MRVAAAIGVDLARTAFVTAENGNVDALRVSDGTFPVKALENLEPVFVSDVASLQSSLRQTGPFHSPWLVSPLKAKLDSEVRKLVRAEHDATTALLATRAVPGMLGADGPRRYLLLFENPAESRASGGVPGDYAEITAVDGKLSLVKVGSAVALGSSGNPAGKHLIGPEDYLARYSQFEPEDYWANVPMSPDFPSVGEVAANLYPECGGAKVNGVISLDPVAMAGFLAAIGPITAPQWPVPVDADNAVVILAHDQYIHFGTDGSLQVQFVQALIKSLWLGLVTRKLPSLPTLANDLLPALRGGHLLLYSETPTSRALLRGRPRGRLHASGPWRLPRGRHAERGRQQDRLVPQALDRLPGSPQPTTDQITAVLTLKLHNLSPDLRPSADHHRLRGGGNHDSRRERAVRLDLFAMGGRWLEPRWDSLGNDRPAGARPLCLLGVRDGAGRGHCDDRAPPRRRLESPRALSPRHVPPAAAVCRPRVDVCQADSLAGRRRPRTSVARFLRLVHVIQRQTAVRQPSTEPLPDATHDR